MHMEKIAITLVDCKITAVTDWDVKKVSEVVSFMLCHLSDRCFHHTNKRLMYLQTRAPAWETKAPLRLRICHGEIVRCLIYRYCIGTDQSYVALVCGIGHNVTNAGGCF